MLNANTGENLMVKKLPSKTPSVFQVESEMCWFKSWEFLSFLRLLVQILTLA
jgi:hypothetical protein